MGKTLRRNKSLIFSFLMLALFSTWMIRRDVETYQIFFANLGAEWLFFNVSTHIVLYIGWTVAVAEVSLIQRGMDIVRMLLRGGRTQAVGYQIKCLLILGFFAVLIIADAFVLQTQDAIHGSVSISKYGSFVFFLYAQLELILGLILYLRWCTGQFVWGMMVMLAFGKWLQLRSPLLFCFSFSAAQPIKNVSIAGLAGLFYMAALHQAKKKDIIGKP